MVSPSTVERAVAASAGTGGSGPRRVSSRAETANEAALAPNAIDVPVRPASAPPIAGPTMIFMFIPRPSSALACPRRSPGTSRLTALLPAGAPDVASSDARMTNGSSTGRAGRVAARAA